MERTDRRKYHKWFTSDSYPVEISRRQANYRPSLPPLYECRKFTCQFHFGELDENGKEIYLPIIDRTKERHPKRSAKAEVLQERNSQTVGGKSQTAGDSTLITVSVKEQQQGTLETQKTFQQSFFVKVFSDKRNSLKTPAIMKTGHSAQEIPHILQTITYEKSNSFSSSLSKKLKTSFFERFRGQIKSSRMVMA